MHSDILQTAIKGGTCAFLSVKCCHPLSSPAGVYLYGVHLVFVSANAVDEILLPLAMALQCLFQLFLYGSMQVKSDCGQRQQHDVSFT